MNSRTKSNVSIGIGAITIAVTLLIFLLNGSENQRIDWYALVFLLISELALFGFFAGAGNKHLLAISGIGTILLFYWLIEIIIAIFKQRLVGDNDQLFLIIQVVITAITCIIVILIGVFGKYIREQDGKYLHNNILNKCEQEVLVLKSNTAYSSYAVGLNNIYEELKYSDKTVLSGKEQEIEYKVKGLAHTLRSNDNETDQEINENMNTIILLIKEHNMLIKSLRKGEL